MIARTVRRLVRLDPATRRRLPVALWALGVAEAGSRLLGLRRFLARSGIVLRTDRVPASRVRTFGAPHERATIDAVERVVRRLPAEGRCLRRALALGWIFRSRGPALCIGVDREGDRVLAHAWIEIDGIPVDPGSVLERFAPLGRSSSPM